MPEGAGLADISVFILAVVIIIIVYALWQLRCLFRARTSERARIMRCPKCGDDRMIAGRDEEEYECFNCGYYGTGWREARKCTPAHAIEARIVERTMKEEKE